MSIKGLSSTLTTSASSIIKVTANGAVDGLTNVSAYFEERRIVSEGSREERLNKEIGVIKFQCMEELADAANRIAEYASKSEAHAAALKVAKDLLSKPLPTSKKKK